MENATKALLMAAGVLIGVLVLSLGVVLFNTFGGFASDTQSKVDANELAKFNEKFLQYNGRTDLTVHDIITAKNYALENNNKFSNYKLARDRAEDNNDYVDVYFGERGYEHMWKDKIVGMALRRSDETMLEANYILYKYTCEVKINNNTGRVNKVYFYGTKK